MLEHHGLLKQLAQSGNYFVGEEKKPNGEPPTYDVLTYVSGSSCLLDLGIAGAVHEFDEIHLEDIHASMPECVEFMSPVTSKGDTQEVSDGMRTDGRATSMANEVTSFYTFELSVCATFKVFNSMKYLCGCDLG